MENINEQEILEHLTKKELDFFESLSPSAKKNFINHVQSAKTQKTRDKRIDEFKGAMDLECKHIFDYKKKLNPREEHKEDLTNDQKLDIYFNKIDNQVNKEIYMNLYNKILIKFPMLEVKYAWNQPMFNYNESFIIAFTTAKNHISIGIDKTPMLFFKDDLEKSEYKLLKKGFNINYTQAIDEELLFKIIEFSIDFKKDATTYFEK